MYKIAEIITSDKFVDFIFNADSEETYNKEEATALDRFLKKVMSHEENQEHVAEIKKVYAKMVELLDKNDKVRVKHGT